MDFLNKGYARVELLDTRIAVDVWKDVDKDEIRKLLREPSDKPWKALTFPRTDSFGKFVQEVDRVSKESLRRHCRITARQNMYRCWDQYGIKHLKPKMVNQHLSLLTPTWTKNEAPGVKEYIWIVVPLIGMNQQKGVILMEGSHREKVSENRVDKPYSPNVPPGWALMFDNRLRTRDPITGGAVVFARCYDMTGLQVLGQNHGTPLAGRSDDGPSPAKKCKISYLLADQPNPTR